jgi:mono/diheme cytochrome c family protein
MIRPIGSVEKTRTPRLMELALLAAISLADVAEAAPDGAVIFSDLCASCHAETRLGGTGPR